MSEALHRKKSDMLPLPPRAPAPRACLRQSHTAHVLPFRPLARVMPGKADITGPVADVNLMVRSLSRLPGPSLGPCPASSCLRATRRYSLFILPCPQGYANPSQIAGGIHTRLFARTFIVADAADPASRVAFVNMDAGKTGGWGWGRGTAQGRQAEGSLAAAGPEAPVRGQQPASAAEPRLAWPHPAPAGMASQAVTFTVLRRLRERYGELYGEQNVALSGTHTHAGPAGRRGGAELPAARPLPALVLKHAHAGAPSHLSMNPHLTVP